MTSHQDNIKRIVEALIFTSDYPIPLKKITEITSAKNSKEIEQIIDLLNKEYKENGR